MNMVKYIVLLLLLTAISSYAMEWDDGGLPGAFLEFGASARAIGMGRAFAGLADDANAPYFNPGGLDQIDPKELTFQHSMLFENTTFDYLAYAHPTSMFGTFGASFMMVRTPDIEDVTAGNSVIGDFGENEFAMFLTMSKQVWSFFSVGINYKLIYHKIAHWGAMGHGADVGFFLFPDKPVSVGLNVQNAVKPSILLEERRDIYPLNMRAGISCKLLNKRLVLDSDIGWSEYQTPRFYEGVEYRPWWPLILRAGVDVNHLNVGLGVRKDAELWSVGVDYAFSNHYQSQGLIPPTHSFSLVINFGGFRAKVIPNKSIFSPLAGGEDNIVWMELNVATRAPIRKWQLRVKNGRGEIVRLYNAWGEPPTRLYWDGRDDTGNLVEDGKYFYEFLVVEESGHTLFSNGHLARLKTLGPEGTVIIQEKGGVLEEREEGGPSLEPEDEGEGEGEGESEMQPGETEGEGETPEKEGEAEPEEKTDEGAE